MIYFIADDVALLSDCVSAFVRTCAPASFSYFHCSHCNTILLFLFIYLPMFLFLFIVLFLFSCPFIFKFPFLLLFPFIFPCRTYSYSNQRVTGFFILGSDCFLILIFRDLPEVMLSQWQHWVSTKWLKWTDYEGCRVRICCAVVLLSLSSVFILSNYPRFF